MIEVILETTDGSFEYGAGYCERTILHGFDYVDGKIYGYGHYGFLSDITDRNELIKELENIAKCKMTAGFKAVLKELKRG